jgi:serine/threonine protein kinase
MSAEEHLQALLLRWEELTRTGQTVSADELCRECPELAAELQRPIDGLREMAWLSGLGTHSPTAAAPGPLAPGLEVVPGYRLSRWLGKGGFGEVWQALAPDGLPVALKLVPRLDRGAALELRSLKVIESICHPHLLATRGAWQTEHFIVVALELADRTLLDRWQEERQQGRPGIPGDELLAYFRQAAEGIDYLHAQSVQHRDIKPQNLLLAGSQVKVADFGLARLLAHTATSHTGVLTLAYAAPEFFDGQTTRHSDQYGLGVTYCLLRGGRLPFAGTPAAVMAGHLGRPPDLTMLPANERPAVARALAKRAGARWPSCRAFVAAVEQAFRSGESPVPPSGADHEDPSGGSQPPRRGWQRRSVLLGGLAALTAPVSVGVMLVDRFSRSEEQRPEDRGVLLGPWAIPSRANAITSPQIRSVRVARYGNPFGGVVALTNGGEVPLLFDLGRKVVLHRFAEGKPGPCADLGPDIMNPLLGASGHDDGEVVVWDLQAKRVVRRFAHPKSVSSVRFTMDGRRLLTGCCDQTVRLWDLKTGQELCRGEGHESIIMQAILDETGQRALSASWDGTVALWDLRRRPVTRPLKQFDCRSRRVYCVAWSPDNRTAACGSTDQVIQIWDLEKGREIKRLEGHDGGVLELVYLGPDHILSAGDNSARIWHVAQGRELVRSPALPSTANSAVPVKIGKERHVLIGTNGHGLWLWKLPDRLKHLV